MTTMMGILNEDLQTPMMVPHWILLRVRNVSNKSCKKKNNNNKNTFYGQLLFPKFVKFMRQCAKTWLSQTGHRWQYDACALHAG